MGFDFATLEPHVRSILTTPGTDLETISAKRVRRQLVEYDSSLTEEFLKEHKGAVDAVIASVYETVREEAAGVSGNGGADDGGGGDTEGSSAGGSQKRKYETDEDDVGAGGDDDEDESATPPVKPKPKKTKRELSDAELARQLSSEINGSTRRSAGRGKTTNGAPKKARQRKSAAVVDSDGESDGEAEKKKKRRRIKAASAAGGTAKGGFAKEYALSEPLAAVLNQAKLSRPQVVKQLWDYIKGNELQNPSNKREIMCDDSLRAVFNVDKIDMFKMNKVLGQHLHEQES
ncbi:hypothetical protein HGRIS_002035 [Hohenbuehelia grisea]|uniref:SWIB-domain-containing protein n=1 Tax=Hohenbuehelia grisea TaxID=104357 RepID=A0ABR3JJ97_9AGAR